MEPKIKIQDYTYYLPDEKIAKYPLAKRDDSKLLIFQNDQLSERKFSNLAALLPPSSLMVFNNTKVVPARLLFKKETGAVIEIFCLEPLEPADYAQAFAADACGTWNVVIGNARKWKSGSLSFLCDESHQEAFQLNLRAELRSKGADHGSVVTFHWDTGVSFSQVLDICGSIPIPPYLKRETEALDLERYQTLYARIKGSVAAPTAGLHFTEAVIEAVDKREICRETICLHVGAGTFVPVKSEYIAEHKMHTEPFEVSLDFLKQLHQAAGIRKVIAVGTTSTRTLESLYFIGVHCIESGIPKAVSQWEPYLRTYDYSLKESIGAIIRYLDKNQLDKLVARTAVIIVPSYTFRVVDVLVTNFHKPFAIPLR